MYQCTMYSEYAELTYISSVYKLLSAASSGHLFKSLLEVVDGKKPTGAVSVFVPLIHNKCFLLV